MEIILRGNFEYVKFDTQVRFYSRSQRPVAWVNRDSNEVGVYGTLPNRLCVCSEKYLEKGSFMNKGVVSIETYFQDWTQPTEQEAEMFFMLFGVEIPWKSIELEVE